MSSSIQSQTKLVVFICPICSKSFSRKDFLFRHEKNHKKLKEFKCEQCNLGFTRSDLLSKHFKSKTHQRLTEDLSKQDGTNENIVEAQEKTGANDMYPSKTFPYTVDKQNIMGNSKYGNVSHVRTGSVDPQNSRSNSASDHYSLNQYANASSGVKNSHHLNETQESKSKFKRLGISSFLNQHSNYERIPTPPSLPSITLPESPKEDSFSLNSNNHLSNSPNSTTSNELIEGRDHRIHFYDSRSYSRPKKMVKRESYCLAPPCADNAAVDNRSRNVHEPAVLSRLTDSPLSGFNDSLDWLFNESSPLDNLRWLFNDSSPLESNTSQTIGAHNKTLIPTQINDVTIPSGVFEESQLFNSVVSENSTDISYDIHPVMCQNLYNESTNTCINNNKIKMTEATRTEIINIFPSIEQLNDISLKRFEEYIDLYWFYFAQTFPIIHQATFNPNTLNLYLLISMVVIGMAHSLDKIEYQTSIALNKKYRRVIYGKIEENTELPLPIMQALILHNFSAKNFGDPQLRKIALIDHGANVMYLKFSGFLDNLTEPLVSKSKDTSMNDLNEQWHNWIYYETCKRMVFFEFICDTQHVTFSKLELLSAFDIKLELPCTDEVWNSADPLKFFEEYQKQPKGLSIRLNLSPNRDSDSTEDFMYSNLHIDDTTETGTAAKNGNNSERTSRQKKKGHTTTESTQDSTVSTGSPKSINMVSKWPTFLWSLKSVITHNENQKEYSLDCYSLFSRYIILHGLLRICWDMRSRGLLDLGIVSKRKLNEFFQKLGSAFSNWKGYFDLHSKLYDEQVKSKGELNRKISPKSRLIFSLNDYGPTNALWANLSFYYTGLFCLYADITSIAKFASEYKNFHSESKAFYMGIKEMEYERNNQIIEQWARSIQGKLSLFEACKFLRLVYGNEETINTFSHIPQTAYLAALLVWSYEIKREYPHGEVGSGGSDADMFKLDTNKYFDHLGDLKFGLVRREACAYFSMILDMDDSFDEPTNDTKGYEGFKERQSNTIGVVFYVLHLLRNCKWIYSIDLVRQLEHVVKTYQI